MARETLSKFISAIFLVRKVKKIIIKKSHPYMLRMKGNSVFMSKFALLYVHSLMSNIRLFIEEA